MSRSFISGVVDELTRLSLTVGTVLLLALAPALLMRPAAADAAFYKSYSTYLNEARPVAHQWWQALEAWQGQHFLIEPVASNTENAAEVQQLLRQWWGPLESRRGVHFLSEPLASNTDSTSELHQILNQWQNALEAWRGVHFLLEPPTPFRDLIVRNTGAFGLTPKRAAVRAGHPFSYKIAWTVPRPNNWHDLKSIDLRVCRKDAVLWIRWSELRNTLSLLDPKGREISKGRVGASRQLKSRTAGLSLAASSTRANGATGRRVVLRLGLTFRRATKGLECGVELAARDDLGNRDEFKRAGRIKIRPG